MRIENQQISAIQKLFNQKSQSEKLGGPKSGREDGVNISPEARLFSVALKAAQALPPRDIKELEALKGQIKADSYEVNNEDIAAKLFDETLF
ncbi:MAG: flagellar biosynthesis anti-sigma factor FlgM [Clostridia bacterium]|jgi:anti-sigma28 factor (negative regulator of flagellin synthesis)|nr:flagellar biosynthesis anti-sigma factor FlgM [Clostridia bacterium]